MKGTAAPPGQVCLSKVLEAQRKIRDGPALLAEATHSVKSDHLADGIDPRSLSIARTHVETAELWAARAIQ